MVCSRFSKKLFTRYAVLVALLVPSSFCFATTGEVSGQIAQIRSHDTSVGIDWVQLVGVSSAGSCSTAGGLVAFMFKDDDRGKRQYSMVMAAYAAGKTAVIGFDDVGLKNGVWCYVRYINY